MEILRTHLQSFLKSKGRNIILLRTGESVSNLAGTLAGWTDSKLSEYGKKQGNLLYEGLHPFLRDFRSFYSSDLIRAKETLKLATLYTVPIHEDERLREIYYGDHEGEHFDTISEEIKNTINSMDYQAPNGESWGLVKNRAESFLEEACVKEGNYLCATHGGLMCTLTHPLGLTDVLPNASIVGITINKGKRTLGFSWICPEILNK